MDAQARPRVHQPCAACKMLRRRCNDACVLSPYFPIAEIGKFAGVHKIFGASNVIKMIQTVDEAYREDAVKALVYEASARLKDPVYGSAGTVFRLQKMVDELRSQLETTSAQVSELQAYRDRLQGVLDVDNNVNCLETAVPNDLGAVFVDDYYSHILSQDGFNIGYNDYCDHVGFPF